MTTSGKQRPCKVGTLERLVDPQIGQGRVMGEGLGFFSPLPLKTYYSKIKTNGKQSLHDFWIKFLTILEWRIKTRVKVVQSKFLDSKPTLNLENSDYSLVGVTVSPGFDLHDLQSSTLKDIQ